MKVLPFRDRALLTRAIVFLIAVVLFFLVFGTWKACALERRPSDGAAPFLGPTGDALISTSRWNRS